MAPSPAKRRRKRKRADDDEDYVPELDAANAEENPEEPVVVDHEEEAGPSTSSEPHTKSKSAYMGFDPKDWSPLYLYRTVGDLTASAIRQSGSEGVGRIEIGKTYGLDTTTKSGNRKVSGQILNVMKTFPEHFGQYQKMEGKFRCIKYFWKVASQPENINKLFKKWNDIVGSPCPFKMGQVVKFPDTKLSTLRISDVSLRRLTDIMGILAGNHIVVTMARFVKMLTDIDRAYGYKYQIDKKSALKCLCALERHKLVKVFDTIVVDESVSHKIQVICERNVEAATDPEVLRAIRVIIDEYHENGRVFPTGQPRFIKKDDESSAEDITGIGKDCNEELAHLETEIESLTVEKRLSLLRLQVARTASIQPTTAAATTDGSGKAKDNEGSTAGGQEKGADTNEADETIELFVEPDVPPKGSQKKKPGSRMDEDVFYGRQSKWNRCYVIHKLAYHFVHGTFERERPTVFNRFPPGKPWINEEGTPLEECPVYVDEESPFRFIPPMPQYAGMGRGWFMVQDFINVLPLSIFALIMKRKVKSKLVEEYLKDPIRRHTLIWDLPRDVRSQLLVNKLLLRQVEHYLLILCGLGVARLGRSNDARKVVPIHSQFFYITKSGQLRDTSTSGDGYANVTLPIEQYDLYNYTFKSVEDVDFFWQHFRAIALSTKLAYKLLAQDEDPSRFKKYALGVFDKTHVYKNYDDSSDTAEPVPPRDGCAGFDSAFFTHLKRHWDLNVRPVEYVEWFIADWRRSAERAKPVIENRVRKLEKTWNSYLKSLLPTDAWVWKKNKAKETVLRPSHILRAVERKLVNKKSTTPQILKKGSKPGSKKRPLDELDIISSKSRLHFRSRFTSRERDMLILIRAVGFFLNPVYRFWLDPSVLRDIMHAYVPESRTKTVQSLMAAGVREMVRPQRIGLLRQIVKNLSSFPEMRALRTKLAAEPATGAIEKRQFFYTAFEAANRNLAMESKDIPSVKASDSVFNKKMAQRGIKVTTETLRSTPLPTRSLKPSNLEQIRHCVAFNVVTAMLLGEKDLNDSRMDAVVEQVSACSLSSILEQLRIDGLLTRVRTPDDCLLSARGQTVLSYYFRHFFNHRFHVDIVDMTSEACNQMADSRAFEEENNPGTIVATLMAFYGKASLEVEVPESVISVFEQSSAEAAAHDEKRPSTATKQLRNLAKTDLRIEDVKVSLSEDPEDGPLPDIFEILDSLNTSILLDSLGTVLFEDFILIYPVAQRHLFRSVYAAAKESGIIGASLDEIIEKTQIVEERVNWALHEMTASNQLVAVGVDCYRYVIPENSSCWLVHCESLAFFPAPWMGPSGDVHYATVRWIAEGVLFSVVDRPGMSLKDLSARFAFALQPRMLVDIVNLLSKCGCANLVRRKVPSGRRVSPFSSDVIYETVEYVTPTVGAMQRFSKLFEPVKLSTMLSVFRTELES